MITAIELITYPPPPVVTSLFFFCGENTWIHFLSKFQVYSITNHGHHAVHRSSEFINWKFAPFDCPLPFPPPPASANHRSTLCYYEFGFLFFKLTPEEMESLDLTKLSTGCTRRSHRP